MNTYTSKTGYVKNLTTNELFKAEVMYLGIYDKAENYEDVSQEAYEAYIKEQEDKMRKENPYEESHSELR